MRLRGCVLSSAAVCGATLLWASSALACGLGGYSYAGIESSSPGYGISAEITALPAFEIGSGHVAGWIGVGGPDQGPNGADEWLQVGVSGFQDAQSIGLYYELTVPGSTPSYHALASGWALGAPARVAILELQRRPNYWRVWLNGSPVSDPIRLPSSHGRWRPVATAESLTDAAGARCNTVLYRFRQVSIARAPGGAWQPLVGGFPISETAARIKRGRRGSFLAALGDRAVRLMASLSP